MSCKLEKKKKKKTMHASMGNMDESDRKKVGTMIEKIHTREKYSVLARRCLDDISK